MIMLCFVQNVTKNFSVFQNVTDLTPAPANESQSNVPSLESLECGAITWMSYLKSWFQHLKPETSNFPPRLYITLFSKPREKSDGFIHYGSSGLDSVSFRISHISGPFKCNLT